MISDAIDDAVDNDEAEEETEELTDQVSFFGWFYLLYLIEKLHSFASFFLKWNSTLDLCDI